MPFEYPKEYNAFRRVLWQKIREKLESYPAESMSQDELFLDLRIFANNLSLESGASLKLVYNLFALRGIFLKKTMVAV